MALAFTIQRSWSNEKDGAKERIVKVVWQSGDYSSGLDLDAAATLRSLGLDAAVKAASLIAYYKTGGTVLDLTATGAWDVATTKFRIAIEGAGGAATTEISGVNDDYAILHIVGW